MAQVPDTNYFLNDKRVSKGFSFYGIPYDKHWIEIAGCVDYPYLEGWYLWNSGIEEHEIKLSIDMNKSAEANEEVIHNDYTDDYIIF